MCDPGGPQGCCLVTATRGVYKVSGVLLGSTLRKIAHPDTVYKVNWTNLRSWICISPRPCYSTTQRLSKIKNVIQANVCITSIHKRIAQCNQFELRDGFTSTRSISMHSLLLTLWWCSLSNLGWPWTRSHLPASASRMFMWQAWTTVPANFLTMSWVIYFPSWLQDLSPRKFTGRFPDYPGPWPRNC